ncbi:hypothetical protein AVEN_148560-1 [Araneus ventricosus]|uniref:Uncharacterized protein n=1 Tax=Araneus ventricosus TaxID=182803 RepID=A0A4Y2FB53_ARAVE|nr:hypothetical protein AVEN_7251-1 [Araneus ventricosus]GBM36824.1 hypothetical protein AVEN_67396-1 [Araneus ventricosus]GBM36836.1 hypothetical protein AVEN_89321-1 [Araneus ventricosus]GBM36851.1 hypothetical protein AVEN_148560-1 [Araneus ventricosus]
MQEIADIVHTSNGHKVHYLLSVDDRAFENPFIKFLDLKIECRKFPTSWECFFILERKKRTGTVSYAITMKRTCGTYSSINATASFDIQNNTLRNGFFHQKHFGRKGMLTNHEIRDSNENAVYCEEMINLYDNDLLVHVNMFVY